jgi:hypothetical protein
MKGQIQATLTHEVKGNAIEAIDTLKDSLPFLLNLSTAQRVSLPKMDDGRRPFVEKALGYGEKESAVVPPYIDLAELRSDLELYSSLAEIYKPLKQLEQLLSDTLIAAGSDSYTAALSIYNSAKRAAKDGVPGAQSIVDDLKKLFE